MLQEELDKTTKRVWDYLEAGSWVDAMIESSNLVTLDPENKANVLLAKCTKEIAGVAEKIKKGSKRGASLRLEEISCSLPELNRLVSFQALVESARYATGKKNVIISLLVAVIFVLVCNFVAYKYIQSQPPHSDAQNDVTRAWLGIQNAKKPVDILLLGDSACVNNLAPGAIADRLGGSVINLGNNAGSSLLMDAWMLSAYVSKLGAPKAVVLSRTSLGYSIKHDLEFLENPILPWAYWDKYGVAPDWQDGEIRKLFIEKYGVLYSYSDVFKERLLAIWNVFDYDFTPRYSSRSYSAGINIQKLDMDISTHNPGFYFNKFYYSNDATHAIQFMTDLARKYKFQLFITLQPEWDEAVDAGLRVEHLKAQKQYLSQFIDPEYVHIVDQVPKTLFTNEQMQSPNHLWHGSEKIYTEEIVNGIVDIQNSLTAQQAKNMELTSVSFDKDSYVLGDQPLITLKVTDPGDIEATSILDGSISCVLKPSGNTDANWSARAPASDIELIGDEVKEISLKVTAGELQSGPFDLVVFLRQDVGSFSHEIRVEIPGKIIVK
jgi:hypothetical protein